MGKYNVRDVLGHYVRPKSARGDTCPHSCCQGRRVHTSRMPAFLPPRMLKTASDNDLADHYQKHGDCPKCQRQIEREMDRRDRQEIARRAVGQRAWSRRMEREEAVEHAFVSAEAATSGYMLNRKGQARGISDRSLFTGSEER